MRVIKKLIRCCVFLAGLVVLLLLLQPIFVPKNNTKEAGIEDVSANGILSEPKDTIELLIVGDSLSHTAISPMLLYRDYGFTSYLCGTYGQYMYDTERYLELAFENQSPKIVILETDTLYRKFDVTASITSEVQCKLNIFRYHNRWKDIGLQDIKGEVNYTAINDYKGYRYKCSVDGIPNEPYMIKTDKVEEVAALNKIYFDNIVEICKENNAKLILVSTPSVKNCSYERHNGIAKLAKEYDLEYIDMNLMQDEVSIDWEKDTRDRGDHLNHMGARKVTKYLGEFLFEKGLLKDYRNDKKYAAWNDSLNVYMEKIEQVYN